jgi:hypothetical protein
MGKRKTGKTLTVLWIYEKLLGERKISKEEVLKHQNISSITFKRYLYNIKDYLAENGSNYVLVYARRYKVYRLIPRDDFNPAASAGEKPGDVGAPKFACR